MTRALANEASTRYLALALCVGFKAEMLTTYAESKMIQGQPPNSS